MQRLPILALALTALLSACGGGGGDDGPAGPTPPGNLTYADDPAAYVTGVAIAPNVPSYTGSVTFWSVSPALPAGLSLNTVTGVIGGTPGAAVPTTNYIVSASNSLGGTSTSLSISVTDPSVTAEAVFVADKDLPGTFGVFAVDADGSNLISVSGTAPSGTQVASLAVSSDGETAAWLSDATTPGIQHLWVGKLFGGAPAARSSPAAA
jgi:hypothetical protein